MKLGELKIECLMHLFPNNKIPYANDDQSITNILDNLRADPNLSDLMVTMIGALNRAISIFSIYGLTEKKRVDISPDKWEFRDGAYMTLINNEDLYRIEWADKPCEIIDGYLLALSDEKPKYIIYRKKHFDITQSTPDTAVLELSDTLCHLLPIYVKGELYSLDSDEKKNAEREFKTLLSAIKENEAITASTTEQIYRVI